MKKLLPFLIAFIFSLNTKAQAPSLTITNLTNSYSITCNTQTITAKASVNNTTITPLTYTWISPSTSLSGTLVNITSAGVYTITAFNTANSFSVTQVYSIGVNTIIPTSTVSPFAQNIVCPVGTPATFTGVTTSTMTNVTHAWQSPYSSGTASSGGTISIQQITAPGTYTYCLTNNISGCKTCKTITITSSSNFATYSITSPQQFTLGCGTTSIATINITNTVTAPPNGPVSFTVLPPSFVGPTYTTSGISSFTANLPGTYTVIVKDNTNLCETKVPITIIQNTIQPQITLSTNNPTLTCYLPSTLLQGSSTNTNVSYSWAYPGFGFPPQDDTLRIFTNLPATNTIIASYTLTISDNINKCKSNQTLTVYQNTAPPTAVISGTNSIACLTASVILTNASISNVPAIFFPTMPAIGFIWYGPVPQPSLSNSPTYIAAGPGTYTLITKDLNNGCTAIATKTIVGTGVYPQLSSPTIFDINCPVPTATIYPTITGPTAGFTYSWTAPASASLSSYTSSTTITNAPGIYTITVTNPITGCSSTTLVSVAICAGIGKNLITNNAINIYPNPNNGVFSIDFTTLPQNSVIEVYSTLGVLVKKQAVISDKNTVNMQSEANGLYFIYVISGEKAIKVSKIVKQ